MWKLGATLLSVLNEGQTVRTVLGQIEPAELGVTLMHEHAFLDWSELYGQPLAPIEGVEEQLLAHAVEMLRNYDATLSRSPKQGGFVEVTPIRVGRYPLLLRALAERAPVHIVAATGFWCEALRPIHPWVHEFEASGSGVDDIAALYVREIEDGIEDPRGAWGEKFTDVPAGVIKVGTSTYLQPSERLVNHAAAIASAHTDCPITTHTTSGGGLEEAQLLLECGARPERIIIGHQGHLDDREQEEALDYHHRLADLGCFVQFDRVGLPEYGLPKQARQVADLVRAGYLGQLLLSHDQLAYSVPNAEAAQKSTDAWVPERAGFSTVTTSFIDQLHEAGVGDSEIDAMLVHNPRRALAF
jgi:predicted metal-dependent phosphotriesterase family hydrolase